MKKKGKPLGCVDGMGTEVSSKYLHYLHQGTCNNFVCRHFDALLRLVQYSFQAHLQLCAGNIFCYVFSNINYSALNYHLL